MRLFSATALLQSRPEVAHQEQLTSASASASATPTRMSGLVVLVGRLRSGLDYMNQRQDQLEDAIRYLGNSQLAQQQRQAEYHGRQRPPPDDVVRNLIHDTLPRMLQVLSSFNAELKSLKGSNGSSNSSSKDRLIHSVAEIQAHMAGYEASSSREISEIKSIVSGILVKLRTASGDHPEAAATTEELRRDYAELKSKVEELERGLAAAAAANNKVKEKGTTTTTQSKGDGVSQQQKYVRRVRSIFYSYQDICKHGPLSCIMYPI